MEYYDNTLNKTYLGNSIHLFSSFGMKHLIIDDQCQLMNHADYGKF